LILLVFVYDVVFVGLNYNKIRFQGINDYFAYAWYFQLFA